MLDIGLETLGLIGYGTSVALGIFHSRHVYRHSVAVRYLRKYW